ncbi:TerC family protein [Sphaerisporangium sp. TRM90804]|uniref:TerC family protein n=1 Tax=Sphaerisporangium sp. TRM90804 TaxID=3031113 RepID=UPI002446D529|nr:TerC family protein [Sphaerisporangium sp. TRM90804]MDH2428298.1 TerC family protein [Sphaerisporangium sp. TRM90804]
MPPPMSVPGWVWAVSIAALLALILLDLVVVDRKPHKISVGEAAKWVAFYVGCAVAFGVGVWIFGGSEQAAGFATGYITEYSLSVDNLFIFMIIMANFAVPAIHQHRVLLIGIMMALVMRGVFIGVGAQAVQRFSWIFWLFGAILIYTAVKLVSDKNGSGEYDPNGGLVRLVRRLFPVTDEYHDGRLVIKRDGRRWLTPMFIVIVAIGGADLVFAVDSIPAIFGITQDAYLVFAANAFALMGLRQLYFLLGGLVEKLVYLSYGLAVILGFIGAKLVLHALHENELPFINGGEHVTWVPEISNWLSLGVIVTVLAVTTLLSILKNRRTPPAAATPGPDTELPAPETAGNPQH